MPTREEKKSAYERWYVCFARHPKVPVWKNELEHACEAARTQVSFRSLGNILVELRWARGVKYDAANKFLQRLQGVSDGAQYSLHSCPEDKGADKVASVAPLAPPVVQPSLLEPSVGASAVSSQVPASPASTQVLASVACSLAPPRQPATAILPLPLTPLKLELSDSAPDHTSNNDFVVDWNRRLGSGTFAHVYAGVQNSTEASVAIKAFADSAEGARDAKREVAAHASLRPHPNVIRVLDVGLDSRKMCIVIELYETDLRALLQKRALEVAELKHIMRGICEGLAHLHLYGLCHTDIKPANMLLRLGLPPPADKKPNVEFALWLSQLPHAMSVCIGDLGNAVLGSPKQRPLSKEQRIREVGVQECTLWYRAPEILLGMAAFSYPIDVWSVGCVAAEMLLRKPLFPGDSQVDMTRRIFQVFGKPTDGPLVGLPLYSAASPAFRPQPWPPTLLKDTPPCFGNFLSQALQLNPQTRTSAADALKHELFRPRRFHVERAGVPAGRGDLSLVQGALDPDLLAWLQADPALADLVNMCSLTPSKCMSPEEGEFWQKYEEGGHVREAPPQRSVVNETFANKPCRSTRVRLFMQEFLRCNRAWLDQLTERVRAALRGLPSAFIGQIGADFLLDSFSDTAFAYSTIQVMCPGPKTERRHYNSGASLLHMGLTIFGARDLECWYGAGSRLFLQRPGSIYVGNMCAVDHRVVHGRSSQCLFGTGNHAVQIAVMFRSDVFNRDRAHNLGGKPTPTDIFDIVNAVVASHLGAEPLLLPDFASVARRDSGGAGSPPLKRKRIRVKTTE